VQVLLLELSRLQGQPRLPRQELQLVQSHQLVLQREPQLRQLESLQLVPSLELQRLLVSSTENNR
jgi:hypothetical protein